jgi:predicted ATP-grasp superfamily ATP-dependent carboligase
MNVFVYEFCCCRPATDATARALRAEGWAMLSALLRDLGRVPGVSAFTLLSEDFGSVPFAAQRVSAADEERLFRERAASADGTLLIAPESDGLLFERCRWTEEAGGRLLGPSAEAVRLTSDKLALAHHCASRGLPMPPTFTLDEVLKAPVDLSFPVVCKPRRGAGSQATYLIHDETELRRRANPESIMQPYIRGTPASVAFLVGPRQCLALPPAAQLLSSDGRFRYLGGQLPLPPALAERVQRLGQLAVAAVSGLRGYVGMDVVLGDAPDGSGDRLMEVNARLTTSYVGLRALCQSNLAEALLCVAAGTEAPELSWRGGTVFWKADGSVLQ